MGRRPRRWLGHRLAVLVFLGALGPSATDQTSRSAASANGTRQDAAGCGWVCPAGSNQASLEILSDEAFGFASQGLCADTHDSALQTCGGSWVSAGAAASALTGLCRTACAPSDPEDSVVSPTDTPREGTLRPASLCLRHEFVCQVPTAGGVTQPLIHRVSPEMFRTARGSQGCARNSPPGWCIIGSMVLAQDLWLAVSSGHCLVECVLPAAELLGPSICARGKLLDTPAGSLEGVVGAYNQTLVPTVAEAGQTLVSFVAALQLPQATMQRSLLQAPVPSSLAISNLLEQYRMALAEVAGVGMGSIWIQSAQIDDSDLLQAFTVIDTPSCPKIQLDLLLGRLVDQPAQILPSLVAVTSLQAESSDGDCVDAVDSAVILPVVDDAAGDSVLTDQSPVGDAESQSTDADNDQPPPPVFPVDFPVGLLDRSVTFAPVVGPETESLPAATAAAEPYQGLPEPAGDKTSAPEYPVETADDRLPLPSIDDSIWSFAAGSTDEPTPEVSPTRDGSLADMSSPQPTTESLPELANDTQPEKTDAASNATTSLAETRAGFSVPVSSPASGSSSAPPTNSPQPEGKEPLPVSDSAARAPSPNPAPDSENVSPEDQDVEPLLPVDGDEVAEQADLSSTNEPETVNIQTDAPTSEGQTTDSPVSDDEAAVIDNSLGSGLVDVLAQIQFPDFAISGNEGASPAAEQPIPPAAAPEYTGGSVTAPQQGPSAGESDPGLTLAIVLAVTVTAVVTLAAFSVFAVKKYRSRPAFAGQKPTRGMWASPRKAASPSVYGSSIKGQNCMERGHLPAPGLNTEEHGRLLRLKSIYGRSPSTVTPSPGPYVAARPGRRLNSQQRGSLMWLKSIYRRLAHSLASCPETPRSLPVPPNAVLDTRQHSALMRLKSVYGHGSGSSTPSAAPVRNFEREGVLQRSSEEEESEAVSSLGPESSPEITVDPRDDQQVGATPSSSTQLSPASSCVGTPPTRHWLGRFWDTALGSRLASPNTPERSPGQDTTPLSLGGISASLPSFCSWGASSPVVPPHTMTPTKDLKPLREKYVTYVASVTLRSKYAKR